jgi:hypothetical protein
VKRRAANTLIWLTISTLAGVAGKYVFGISFWLGFLLALLSLIVNGIIAGGADDW